MYNYPAWLSDLLKKGEKLTSSQKQERVLDYITSQRARGEVEKADYIYKKLFPKEIMQDTELAGVETVEKADKIPGGLAEGKKPTDFDKESLKEGILVEMEHTSDRKVAMEIAMDHLTEDPEYYKKLKTIEKGGPGSGQRGHTTNKPSTESKHSNISVNIVQGKKTASGKPIFLDYESAVNHGYTSEDHRDASNFHYDLSQKLSEEIAKRREVDKKFKVPAKAQKVLDLHNKLFRMHHAEATRNVKDISEDPNKVKKSMVGMDSVGTEMETSDYAVERTAASEGSYWYEIISERMRDFDFGETPRQISLEYGYELFLAKVDDGLYSGHVKRLPIEQDSEVLPETVLRIERETIPTLIQHLRAKEYIDRPEDVAATTAMQEIDKEISSEESEEEITPAVVIVEEIPEITEEPKAENLEFKLKVLNLLAKLLD